MRVVTQEQPKGVWISGFTTDPDTIYDSLGISLDKTFEVGKLAANANATASRAAQVLTHLKAISSSGKTPASTRISPALESEPEHWLPSVFLSESQVRSFMARCADGRFTKKIPSLKTKHVYEGLSEKQKSRFREEVLQRKSFFSEVKGHAKTNMQRQALHHPPQERP